MDPKPTEYPSDSEAVTTYDRRYFKPYIVLLDAEAAGIEWLDTYRKNFKMKNIISRAFHYAFAVK